MSVCVVALCSCHCVNVNVYEYVLVSVFACMLVFVFVGYGVCEHWCVCVFVCVSVCVCAWLSVGVCMCACVPVCVDVRVSGSVDAMFMRCCIFSRSHTQSHAFKFKFLSSNQSCDNYTFFLLLTGEKKFQSL